MPYIKQQDRAGFDPTLRIAFETAEHPGELNFQITRLCDDYLKRHGIGYTQLNEVIGVLECAKLEYYRRVAAQYEDTKCDQNGDVYEARQG